MAKGESNNSNGNERTMSNTLLPPLKTLPGKLIPTESKLGADHRSLITGAGKEAVGSSATSPVSTAPSSPRMYVHFLGLSLDLAHVNSFDGYLSLLR